MLDPESISALVSIIATQGEAVTFINPNPGVAANEWEVAPGTAQEIPGQAYITPVDFRRLEGNTIQATDSTMYLNAPDAPSGFRDDWRVRRADNTEFSIVDLRTYRSGNADVFHEIVIRT